MLHGEVKTPPFSKESRIKQRSAARLQRLNRSPIRRLPGDTLMNKTKRSRLEARGWRSGSAAHFLELTPKKQRSLKRSSR
jgi:hypothetical protein